MERGFPKSRRLHGLSLALVAGLVNAVLCSTVAASEFGPFTRAGLIEHELNDIAPEAAQPFADALARSEQLAAEMAAEIQTQSPEHVLVLYDWIDQPEADLQARLAAIMVRNLIGHFDLDVTLQRVNAYEAGTIGEFDATFYVGMSFGNRLPPAFIRDAIGSRNTVVWMQYNLEQVEQVVPGALTARGITYQGTAEFPEVIAGRRPSFYDSVFYKGLPFRKWFTVSADGQRAFFDPEIIQIRAGQNADVRVEIGNSQTGEIRPYITRSGNFWFMGDVPLTFAHARDRYIVFADLLHDMLGINHPEQHNALVRIEDLHSEIDLEGFSRLTGLLEERSIPYSLAVIPEYREVLADGSVLSIPMDTPGAEPLRRELRAAVSRGADVVMHGSTHQYGDRPNPDRGLTGIDYEFWDVLNDRPVPNDSLDWASARLQRGFEILERAGLDSPIYEVPHYLGSPSSYHASSLLFPFSYHRVTYHGADDVETLPDDLTHVHEMQFFPYLIHEDHYGQIVVPENLGNLQYVGAVQSADFLLRNAAYGRTVRDGVASVFIHSFLFVPYSGNPGYSDFARVVDGISSMGYEWIGVSDYLEVHGLDPDEPVNMPATY